MRRLATRSLSMSPDDEAKWIVAPGCLSRQASSINARRPQGASGSIGQKPRKAADPFNPGARVQLPARKQ